MRRGTVVGVVLGVMGAAGLAGCSDEAASPPPGGQGVEVTLAALERADADVVWDVEVVNGRRPAPEVMWRGRVVAPAGADPVALTAPCDAAPERCEHTVRAWLVGVYAPGVTPADAGAFDAGSSEGAGAVVGAPVDVVSPTARGPLTAGFTCGGGEARVSVELTVARPADQSFFDHAVSFGEVVCAARLDCCNDLDGDGCDVDGSEDIRLLDAGAGDRGRTIVLAFACAGLAPGAELPTLYLDDVELDCDVGSDGARFVPDVTLRPGLAATGLLCKPGPDGVSSCGAAVVEAPGVDADQFLFQVGVYRGQGELPRTDVAVRDVYWNVVLGVKSDIAKCHLRTRATAGGAADSGAGLVAGVVAAGAVYPQVTWDAPLGACSAEVVWFHDPAAFVRADYTPLGDAPAGFDFAYSPLAGVSPVCTAGCQHGGACVAPDMCSCEGTGFAGPTCAQCGQLGAACAEGFACGGAGSCERPESGEVWIPQGGFWMGCNEALEACAAGEGPQHHVELSGYAIDALEVTAADFRACVDAGACTPPAVAGGAYGTYGVPEKADHPLTFATWDQAAAYCAWSGKAAGEQRLCTEAEWERASRGGCELVDEGCRSAMRTFPWGEVTPDCKRGNVFGVASASYCHPSGYTAEVGATPLGDSPYGVADMAGNVAEWVSDFYAPGYSLGAASDPVGPGAGREHVVRGGSFADIPARVRASARDHAAPDAALNAVGFRCCRSVP